VAGGNPDPSPANNTARATTVVSASAQPVSHLSIVKTVDRANASPGHRLTYTIKVTNRGPDPAANVRVTDTSNVELRVHSVSPSKGSCQRARRVPRCLLGVIRPGASGTITVVGEAQRAGSDRNTATTTSASRDPRLINNINTARTTVTATLRLSKAVAPQVVQAGRRVTYRLTVGNPTGVAIANVTVCDMLPLGLAPVSSSPRGRLSDGRLCWTIERLKAERSEVLEFDATALRGTHGKLTNHATARARGARTAAARSTVDVLPAAPSPTPVTG
jgi:uncharacterized repeat protein (TIGR01451 family)